MVGCNENITLRSDPSPSAVALDSIPLCSPVTFNMDMMNGFFSVTYRGQTGYVLAEYLDFYEPQVFSGYMKVVNCKESISLRNAANTAAKALTQIPLGTPVVYCGKEVNGFYLVSYDGQTGWALANYLSPYSY